MARDRWYVRIIVIGRLIVLAGLLLAACAPLSIVAEDQQDAYRRLNRTVLSDHEPSETTLTTLRRHGLADSYWRYTAQTIAALHSQVVGQTDAWSDLFALAELSFQVAQQEKAQGRFLAAALYAYAFLFPDDPAQAPSPYDPRFRQACDLYNLALTSAMVPSDRGEAVLRPGRYDLPFGSMELTVDEASLSLGGRRLTGLVPTGTLRVDGVVNQYRTPGIGAPMAARVSRNTPVQGFQVAPRLRVPATLLLRLPSPRQQLATGTIHADLAVYNIFDSAGVTLGGRRVPLEYDQTAARSISLVETEAWRNEYRGFLQGTILDHGGTRLVAIEPHRRGRMPVVLVHGTASSPFRWSDMINDLLEDPHIRENFEFWLYTYPTGNPIPDSAMHLHDSLQQAIAALGGTASDPALGHVTLIGHSQGGLLIKLQVIDPGSRLWDGLSHRKLDELKLNPATRDLLRHALFPVPVPEVDRVVFIATPHRGSYVAGFSISQLVGRLVTLPLAISKAGAEVLTGNADAMRFDASRLRLGSVYAMTPGHPFIRALADIPVVARVHAHSIIPVQTDGPLEDASDGVVEYASAHIDGVESEKVVRNSGHSTQSNPVTIEEVRRILLLQLAAVCGGTDCSQPRVAAQ